MSKFYIYHHLRNDTGQPFYVGKGFAKRAQSKSRRNKHWQSVVAKHGYAVEIVIDNLTEQEAFECERMLIADYRAAGHKLANKTDGGEGLTGYKATGKTRRKYFIAAAIRSQNPDWRRRNADANRKSAQNPDWICKNADAAAKRSQNLEWRRKNAEANKQKALNETPTARAARIAKGRASLSIERRAEIARKGHETRAKRKGQKNDEHIVA